jgi:ABC-2 type transport system ATP-binding protein
MVAPGRAQAPTAEVEMAEPSVEAQGICKSYRSFLGRGAQVLKDISLEVGSGEIFGLLGPNGSGKTTLISIFSTLIFPDRGRLKVLGLEAERNRAKIRGQINFSTAKPNFPWSLTVSECLKHYGMLYGMYGSQLSGAIEEVIAAFELEEQKKMKFEDLSTGMKQRLSLAKAMLNRPRLLFLDEPTAGLDPDMAIKTRKLIRGLHQEQDISIVLCTHDMAEAELLCSRVAFLRRGEVVALDTPQNLKNQLRLGERLVILYQGRPDLKAVERVPGVLAQRGLPGRAEIVLDRTSENLDMILKLFAETKILDIRLSEPDLEDVFLELAR